MNNRQTKIINKIAQPIAKQLYANGWRNVEQIRKCYIEYDKLYQDFNIDKFISLLFSMKDE